MVPNYYLKRLSTSRSNPAEGRSRMPYEKVTFEKYFLNFKKIFNTKINFEDGDAMKNTYSFSREDMRQIKALGLARRDVEKQLAVYFQGPSFLKLNRPCTRGDGILAVTPAQRKALIRHFETEAVQFSLIKFVPASGAASRMFAHWFTAARQGGFGNASADLAFFRHLKKMPFTPLLLQRQAARSDLKQKNISGLLEGILSEKGMNYGWLPKALIHFHAYPEGEVRTAFEEHLVEAASYIRDAGGTCRLHVTLSEEHIPKVKAKLREVKSRFENQFQVRLKVTYSVQSPATNMVAVDESLTPFRGGDGRLVFRPGGHGSLLKNLAALDADFIFVKNIDNIVPYHLLQKILPYKKMLGGLALQIQQSVFSMLRDLERGAVTAERMEEIAGFCRQTLHLAWPSDFSGWPLARQKKKLFSLLNRPLRICGMVRNEGEPGGGPFWVDETDGAQSLQIVESVHVNFSDPEQQAVWTQSEYFNPVDMVCCTRDFHGNKFHLEKYVNHDAYLISAKTEKGRKLLAQELPGLWNGGMAFWNTVFVELPIAVFNPVKTVDDLLRPQHTAGRRIRMRK